MSQVGNWDDWVIKFTFAGKTVVSDAIFVDHLEFANRMHVVNWWTYFVGSDRWTISTVCRKWTFYMDARLIYNDVKIGVYTDVSIALDIVEWFEL